MIYRRYTGCRTDLLCKRSERLRRECFVGSARGRGVREVWRRERRGAIRRARGPGDHHRDVLARDGHAKRVSPGARCAVSPGRRRAGPTIRDVRRSDRDIFKRDVDSIAEQRGMHLGARLKVGLSAQKRPQRADALVMRPAYGDCDMRNQTLAAVRWIDLDETSLASACLSCRHSEFVHGEAGPCLFNDCECLQFLAEPE